MCERAREKKNTSTKQNTDYAGIEIEVWVARWWWDAGWRCLWRGNRIEREMAAATMHN